MTGTVNNKQSVHLHHLVWGLCAALLDVSQSVCDQAQGWSFVDSPVTDHIDLLKQLKSDVACNVACIHYYNLVRLLEEFKVFHGAQIVEEATVRPPYALRLELPTAEYGEAWIQWNEVSFNILLQFIQVQHLCALTSLFLIKLMFDYVENTIRPSISRRSAILRWHILHRSKSLDRLIKLITVRQVTSYKALLSDDILELTD